MKTLKLLAVAAIAAAALTACSGDKAQQSDNTNTEAAQAVDNQPLEVNLEATVSDSTQLDSAIEQATDGQAAEVVEIDVNN